MSSTEQQAPSIGAKEFFRKLAKEKLQGAAMASDLSGAIDLATPESTDFNTIKFELDAIQTSFQNLFEAMKRNEFKFASEVLKMMQQTAWSNNFPTFSVDIRRATQQIIKDACVDDTMDQYQLEEKTEAWQLDFSSLKLGKKIAEGFFGEVYKGTMWEKKVAVKRLKFSESIVSDEKEKDKLIRKLKEEAAIMSSIRHPNVLLFMGLSSTLPNICLVTEFMENGALDGLLETRVVDDRIFFRMLKDICYGMNYLHNRSILHLDLKPLNLLVDENLTIKVSDFGISRIAQNFESGIKAHQGYGTILYMPPEVLMGGSDDNTVYDYTFDVFSFGVMLFELLLMRDQTGINFAKQDSIGYDLIREPLMHKSNPKLRPWWSKKLCDLVVSCTHNDVKKRPRFEAILKVLEPIVAENEWFLLRENAKSIRSQAMNKDNHAQLLQHNVWETLEYYIDRYADPQTSFDSLCAMIELAQTSNNVSETLNQVVTRMQVLAYNMKTGMLKDSFIQVVDELGDFSSFQKLLNSPYLMSYAKDNVLKILLGVSSNERVAEKFLKHRMIKFLYKHICQNTTQNVLLYNLHHNTCMLLKIIGSYENKHILSMFVSDGGLDLLIYFANNGTKNLVFLALQTLAELTIKDSSIAVKIDQKGIKPTQLASRAYLGALLAKNELMTAEAPTINQRSSLKSNLWSLARDKLSNALDPLDQRYRVSMDEGEVLVKLWEHLKEQPDLEKVDTITLRNNLQSEFSSKLIDHQIAIEAQIEKVVGQMEPPTKINDFLYLGSEWNSSHLSDLQRLQIKDVVNLSGESPNYFPTQFTYKNLRIDRNDPDIAFETSFSEIYQFIDRSQASRRAVLIHSYLGVGRSAAFVIAYLMKHENWSLSKALKHVKDRRPFIQISRKMMKALMDFELSLGFEGSLGLSSLQVLSPRTGRIANGGGSPQGGGEGTPIALTPRSLAKLKLNQSSLHTRRFSAQY